MIRLATPADIPAISAIQANATAAARWSEQDYQRACSRHSNRLALVAERGGVRGFLVAQQIGPEWELENMAVDAGAQRRGIGSALLRHLFEIARQRGSGTIYLEVRASNAAARALYQKHGFIETGRRPGYYQDPAEDAVLYRKLVGT